jgi:hypothetical protein
MATVTEFQGAPHRVTIGSITKQSSNGRITFPLSMALTGETLGDLPDWVSEGYEAVSKTFTSLDPEVQEVADILLAFSNGKPKGLFKNPDAKVPSATLRGFTITRVGDPDDPEVELHFKAFCPFSRDFWAWAGEMCGEEVYMNFPTALATGAVPAVAESGTLPLSEGAGEQDSGDAAGDGAGKKSGPKKLKSAE